MNPSNRPRWSPKLFALLLERARGVRSWRQFAAECGVSYGQMRKLYTASQENPPRPRLIRKLASKSFGDVDLEDFLFAAGLNTAPGPAADGKKTDDWELFRALKPRDQETVRTLMEILSRPSDGGESK